MTTENEAPQSRDLLVAGGRVQLTEKQALTIEELATEAGMASHLTNIRAREAVYQATKSLLQMSVVGIDPPSTYNTLLQSSDRL